MSWWKVWNEKNDKTRNKSWEREGGRGNQGNRRKWKLCAKAMILKRNKKVTITVHLRTAAPCCTMKYGVTRLNKARRKRRMRGIKKTERGSEEKSSLVRTRDRSAKLSGSVTIARAHFFGKGGILLKKRHRFRQRELTIYAWQSEEKLEGVLANLTVPKNWTTCSEHSRVPDVYRLRKYFSLWLSPSLFFSLIYTYRLSG